MCVNKMPSAVLSVVLCINISGMVLQNSFCDLLFPLTSMSLRWTYLAPKCGLIFHPYLHFIYRIVLGMDNQVTSSSLPQKLGCKEYLCIPSA